MQSFKKCANCGGRIPESDGHDLCIVCLAVEDHDDSACSSCSGFSARTKKRRGLDLVFYKRLHAAGEDVRNATPPSKLNKQRQRQVISPPIPSGSQSSDSDVGVRLVSARVKNPPALTPTDINALIKGQMKGMLGELMQEVRKEILASRPPSGPDAPTPGTSRAVDVVDAGAGSGMGPGGAPVATSRKPRKAGAPSATITRPISPTPGTSGSGDAVGDPKSQAPGASAQGTAPGLGARPPVVEQDGATVSAFRIPLLPPGSSVDALDDSESASDSELLSERSESDMEVEGDGESEAGDLSINSALREIRGKVARAFPRTAVPQQEADSSEFRLPGGAFASRKSPQVRLRIIDHVMDDAISPLLSGTRKRFDLPELHKRYPLGEEGLFEVPGCDDDVLASISLESLGLQGRCVPPFRAGDALLKQLFRTFEGTFRGSCQQMRVAVHSAYLASLQAESLKEGKGKSSQALLQRQLTEANGYLANDSIRSSAGQIMSAVMGLRRVWLNYSTLPQPTKKILLALPFELGSTLFPGASKVIKDTADQLARIKDVKGVLGQVGSKRKSPLVDPPSGPPAKTYSEWNTSIPRGVGRGQPGKRGKKQKGQRRSKGQQQPFRGRGGAYKGP